eukprot:m.290876 g.290876  ORF g.290876 m.290876 type:complete len:81 (+) comp12373_c0_seq1:1541-1783(+)
MSTNATSLVTVSSLTHPFSQLVPLPPLTFLVCEHHTRCFEFSSVEHQIPATFSPQLTTMVHQLFSPLFPVETTVDRWRGS